MELTSGKDCTMQLSIVILSKMPQHVQDATQIVHFLGNMKRWRRGKRTCRVPRSMTSARASSRMFATARRIGRAPYACNVLPSFFTNLSTNLFLFTCSHS